MYCQLESIRHCVKLSALRKALSTLPRTLDETYARILQSLGSTGQLPDAITALQWLCYSNRPLQLSEVVEILAIENGDDGGFDPEERLPDPADIMLVCSSLISYNVGGSNSDDPRDGNSSGNDSYDDSMAGGLTTQIRLAHFSVKEYLLSDRCLLRLDFQMPSCHMAMAEGCLHYLLYLYENLPLTKDLVDQHPLSQYAAEHWWQHAQSTDHILNPTVINLARRMLMYEDAGVLPWVQLYNVDAPWQGMDLSLTTKDVAQPLYYAASIGVWEVIENIIPLIDDVNAQGGRYGNALQAASVRGYEKIVQILLDVGVDVNANGGRYGDALQAASARGHEKVVQILLDGGADVKANGGYYGNALQAALHGGYQKVVQILLDSGADIKADGGLYGNALQAASYGGDEKVVQMLLDAGANVKANEGGYGNALQAASAGGYEKVVQMLLDAGADVEADEGGYGNALQAACFHGHEKVVQMLLDAGANVKAAGGGYGTALQAALHSGHEKVVQMLLDAKANVHA